MTAEYPTAPPEAIPPGQVLVHNQVCTQGPSDQASAAHGVGYNHHQTGSRCVTADGHPNSASTTEFGVGAADTPDHNWRPSNR